MAKRCEGYIRHGGVFTLGNPVWVQCSNDAIVTLKIKQEKKKVEPMPACRECWQKALDPRWNIKILSAEPIKDN